MEEETAAQDKAETQATETPATETPATETPATETPATETPPTETPPTDAPATDGAASTTNDSETPKAETVVDNSPPSESERKIIRQMEYYFGDINMPRDRFMQESIKEDDGWLTLQNMLNFNRLKQLSEDLGVIRNALRKSTSGLLEISEDGTKLRRNPAKPIPENTAERRQELAERSVYAKGFSLDATLDQLYDFFEPYGRVDSLFMRRDQRKKFKGSVFMTFDTVEDFKKFLELESIQWQGTELIKKPKLEYFKIKDVEKKERLASHKKKVEENKVKLEENENKKLEHQITKGAILYFSGFSEESTREDIKNMLQDLGDIAWVDFNKGDKEAWIRYNEEGKAKEVLEGINKAMDNEVKLNGNVLSGRVLEGEAELEQWKKMFRDIENKKHRNYGNRGGNRGGNRRGGGGRGRGGYRGGGGRPGKFQRQQYSQERKDTRGDDGPAAKKMKVEVTISTN